MNSGFCFVTFSEHTAPVTAVSFLPTSSAAGSASLDGTVPASDLLRYRNFRTMTTPDPVQLASLAVDPAGEVSPISCLAEDTCRVMKCRKHRPAFIFGDFKALALAVFLIASSGQTWKTQWQSSCLCKALMMQGSP